MALVRLLAAASRLSSLGPGVSIFMKFEVSRERKRAWSRVLKHSLLFGSEYL